MDYKVLYRKYRPDDFSNIIGQDYMISILKNAILQDKISHAYIFSGPRGTGKTSTAKVFAKAINCLNPKEDGPCNECDNCKHFKENADIIEIDAASNNGVEEIREIINNIKLAPAYSKYKVYIIDEVHMLSTSAFNALLLTLEEPPKHVVFILATTNIEAVPITILSRCQRFDFHKISIEDIIKRLKYVVESEKIKIDEEAIEEIAYISDGGMRDALSILDQLSSNKEVITIKDVEEHFGSVSKKQINDLYNLIKENNVNNFIEEMKKYKKLAIDYKLLIKKLLEKIEEEAIESKIQREYNGISYENLKNMAYDLASISNYINLNVDPYLLIEITLLNYFPGNNLKVETTKKEAINEIKEQEVSYQETKSNQNSEKIDDPIKLDDDLCNIRVNNCFVNAKKEFLQDLEEKWKELLKNMEDKKLLSLIIDTKIVAASDKVAIIEHNLEGAVDLINFQIDMIATEFNKKFNSDYKFVALSSNSWQTEKNKYIKNLKNKIIYKYIEEPELAKKDIEPTTEIESLEKTALNIFDKEKIEIE